MTEEKMIKVLEAVSSEMAVHRVNIIIYNAPKRTLRLYLK